MKLKLLLGLLFLITIIGLGTAVGDDNEHEYTAEQLEEKVLTTEQVM